MPNESIHWRDTSSQPENISLNHQVAAELDRLTDQTEPDPDFLPVQERPCLDLSAIAGKPAPYSRRLRLHPGEPIRVYCGDSVTAWNSARSRNESVKYACDALVWPHPADPHAFAWPVDGREVTVIDSSRHGLGATLKELAEALLAGGATKVYIISQSAPKERGHLAIFTQGASNG